MPSHHHQAFSLLFDSEIPLPGLPIAEPGEPDVKINLGKLPPLASAAILGWTASLTEAYFRFEGVAGFLVREGREIIVDLAPDAPLEEVVYFLRGPVFGALLMQQGFIPLHASAVDSSEGAIIFMGRSGVGKSTLAAALARRGYPLICDEMAALRVVDGCPLITAGISEHQLWADSLEALKIGDWSLSPIRAGLKKYRLPCALAGGPVRPIRAIFLLVEEKSPRLEVNRASRDESLDGVLHNCYRWRILGAMGQLGERLNLSNSLLALDRTYKLLRPRNFSRLDELCDCVISALAPAPSSAAIRRKVKPPLGAGYVWLASYPKSGNTWLRALFTAWRRLSLTPNLASLDAAPIIADRHLFEEVMGVEADFLNMAEIQEWRSRLHIDRASFLTRPTLMKVHDVCNRVTSGKLLFPPEATVGVIYVIRNPLDVAVSFSHHYQMPIDKAAGRLAIEDTWIHFHGQKGGVREALPQRIGNWSEHVRSWVNESGHRCLVVRYEDLLAAPLEQFKRILLFLGETWNEDRAQKVVEQCSFANLKKEEEVSGFREKPVNVPRFFRKGIAGGWREALTADLARQISQDHREMMERFGYEQDAKEALALSGERPIQ